jgi:translation initiation factor IF-2
MPESTRKRSSAAAKAAAEPDAGAAATPTKTAKATKVAKAEPKAAAGPTATKAEPKPAAGPTATKAPKAAKPAAEPEPAVPDEQDDTGTEFLNRAARRAKGRGKGGQQPVSGRDASLHGRGAVPGQRQWGTRRTGG